jgi:HEAT repeat protein
MLRVFVLTLVACISLAFAFATVAGQEKKVATLDETIKIGKFNLTVGEWIKMLREHENPRYRRVALIALEASNTARSVGLPALLDATNQKKEKEPQVRLDAVLLLGRQDTNTRGAMKTLVEVLQTDKADEVREAAANAIGNKFVKQAPDYLSVLTEALKDPHVGTRIAVAGTLRNMEDDHAKPAVPVLLELARNSKENTLVRGAALHVVSRHGKDNPKTLPLMLDLLKNSDTPSALREAAADGLGRCGSESADAVTALSKTLDDKNLELRKAAAVALGTLGIKAKDAWPTIKTHLGDPKEDSSIRNHLIRLTGALGKTNDEAIKLLTVAAVQDKSTENRIAAIQELAELGPQAKGTVNDLSEIARQDPRAAIREAASKAVKKISGK